MDWIEEFYRRQDEWSAVYRGDVDEYRRAQAARITRLSGKQRARVLELGAGAGQAAAAAADAGHTVTAVELVPALASRAARLAVDRDNLHIVRGDFYTVPLEGPYDVVCYWDGFGSGSDDDQRRLLRRVWAWLTGDGCALIEIYTPWFWAQKAGDERQVNGATRRYGFDAEGCRMLDSWWPTGEEDRRVTQSLRCYTPADLRLLLEGTGLRLDRLEPGGGFDEEGHFQPQVPLARAMQYVALLKR